MCLVAQETVASCRPDGAAVRSKGGCPKQSGADKAGSDQDFSLSVGLGGGLVVHGLPES